jgi:hypothetical protein
MIDVLNVTTKSCFVIERDGLPYCEFKRFGSIVGHWGLIPRVIDYRGSEIHVATFFSVEHAQRVINRSHVYFKGASIVEVDLSETTIGARYSEVKVI